MRVEKFVATKSQKVSEQVCNQFGFFTYNFVQKLIRNKDIKVNGVRVKTDAIVNVGDEIELYYNESVFLVDIVYEDENILIANKPRGVETCSDENIVTLQELLNRQTGLKLYAVHRLDKNTIGLNIFAKNTQAKEALDDAIKNRDIEKYYLTLVIGKLKQASAKCKAYLKKDAKNSFVKISNTSAAGFEPIETDYKVLKTGKDMSLVEVLLVTGKTHQIRAHFAFMGNAVVGDEKYGDSAFNKKHKVRFQELCAYKLIFKFKKDSPLEYLNDRQVELSKIKDEFLKKL